MIPHPPATGMSPSPTSFRWITFSDFETGVKRSSLAHRGPVSISLCIPTHHVFWAYGKYNSILLNKVNLYIFGDNVTL